MLRLCSLLLWLLPVMSWAETLRVATFHTELAQKGPGLLYQKLQAGDAQSTEIAGLIVQADADIIVLQGIDYDHDLLALTTLRDLVARHGVSYPHIFARPPNTGLPMPHDINGDGRIASPGDTQSYALFAGQSGMVVLSKHPVLSAQVTDLTPTLWRDALSPDTPRDGLFPQPDIWETQRLSATAHWALPFDINGTRLTLLTSHNSPPVFDGPEDRNGWRNHDETHLWLRYLDGAFGPPQMPLIYAGVLNADPARGDARKEALALLLTHPALQDLPDDATAPTVNWPSTGPMRVSYILPSASLQILDHGQIPAGSVSRHALLWLDVNLPD